MWDFLVVVSLIFVFNLQIEKAPVSLMCGPRPNQKIGKQIENKNYILLQNIYEDAMAEQQL